MREKTIQEANIRRKHCRGATIVETIVALTILAVFISGAVRVVMSHRQLTDKARAHYTAINIAKNRVEQVRNMRRADYSQIAAMIESDTLVDKDGDPAPVNQAKYSRTTNISGTSVSELLEIEVIVKIKDPITLQFKGENEHIRSYMAKLLAR